MCTTSCHHHSPSPQARPNQQAQAQRQPERAYLVETLKNPDGSEEILSVKATEQSIQKDQVVLRSLPYGLAEHEPSTAEMYTEALIPESSLTEAHKEKQVQAEMMDSMERWPGAEVRTIVEQGPVGNRIDLTIVGDGYTEAEKTRFFEDAKRLTDDMFVGDTFASYLPLFNVHAVFVPSKESGLTDETRKDTALGLYRSPANSKRGVMPGNRSAIERALALAPDTDYPILVANDDFYGGLGGRYAITTRSHNSGTMVLRHELGHNFGNVGEEYDGGQVYSGANHSRSARLPWEHWTDGEGKVHQAKALATGYPWKNLAEGPISMDFRVPEGDANGPMQVGIDVSSVGWDGPQDVEILINGEPQEYEGVFTEDRSFFRLKEATSLPAGRHKLTIKEKITDGNNVVAAVRINAYPADYDFTPDKVGGFPTFNHAGQHVGYRPTHESCLMRNMRETKFCSVDQENMWHQFLRRVELVDAVEVQPLPAAQNGQDGGRLVEVKTPELDGLDIRWYQTTTDERGRKKEVELPELHNKNSWVAGEDQAAGDYRVEVRFSTDEVRQYSDRFRTEKKFRL